MTGPISTDIATEKYLRVTRGVVAKEHVPHWGLTFPVFTIRKKMFTSKVFTAENTLGWD